MPSPTENINIQALLSRTEALMSRMHAIRADFEVSPRKEHIATCINYIDLLEDRRAFLLELISNVTKYVYSSSKCDALRGQLMTEGRDLESAVNILRQRAVDKFRPSDLRGQFSELILFALLQAHFSAAPLVRKMPITTDPQLERNGADAIHIARVNGDLKLFLGEAKTYHRKHYSFNNALRDSIDSIIQQWRDHLNETSAYAYDGFVEPELEQLARDYVAGNLRDIEVELVCLVTYNDDNTYEYHTRQEILDGIISNVNSACTALSATFFERIPATALPRLNYIFFPVQNLNELTSLFGTFLYGGNDA